MMKKTFLSLVLTLFGLLLLTSAAGAYTRTVGDVDFNGRLEAADARLALRAAVDFDDGLKELDRRAADWDQNGRITAADARFILRAAVELEDASRVIHIHEPAVSGETETVKAPTCKAEGEYRLTVRCTECGQVVTVETGTLPRLAHTPGEPLRETVKAPTCTASGETRETVRCVTCGEIISTGTGKLPRLPHDAVVAGAKNALGEPTLICRCRVCGRSGINYRVLRLENGYRGDATDENIVLVNALLDSVKTAGGNYVSLEFYRHDVKRTDSAFEITSGLSEAFKALNEGQAPAFPTTKDEFDRMLAAATHEASGKLNTLSSATALNENTFPLKGKAQTSLLGAADVRYLAFELVSDYDFVSALPETIEDVQYIGVRPDNGAAYYRNAARDDAPATREAFSSLLTTGKTMLRLTVELRDEAYPTGTTVPEDENLSRLFDVQTFDFVTTDLRAPALALAPFGNTDWQQNGNMQTSGKAVFYFDAATLQPLAAVYDSEIVSANRFAFTFETDGERLFAQAQYKSDTTDKKIFAFGQ